MFQSFQDLLLQECLRQSSRSLESLIDVRRIINSVCERTRKSCTFFKSLALTLFTKFVSFVRSNPFLCSYESGEIQHPK